MMSDQISIDAHLPEPAQRKVTELSGLISSAIQQVRSLSHLLHPPLLDEVGLHFALRSYLDGLTKRSGVETEIDFQPAEFPRFTPELETAIFRIIQEALTNVFRHSGARKAWVTIVNEGDQLSAQVRDDGKGISEDIERFQSASIGIGIGGMIQRVKEFGGELKIRNSRPGTIVEVSIPVRAAAEPPDRALPAVNF
jgi:two-component system NarL family sensor kinase